MIDLPAPSVFSNALSQLAQSYGQTVKVPAIITAEIEHLTALMPIPGADPFWSEIPPDQYEELLATLNTTLQVYVQALDKKQAGVTAKESNTVYTFLAITHYLAIAHDQWMHPEQDSSDPVTLAHYPVYFPAMMADNDPYLLFTTPEDYVRREALIAYFKSFNSSTEAYQSTSLFDITQRETAYSTFDSQVKGLAKYLLALTTDSRLNEHLTADAIVEWKSAKESYYRDEKWIFFEKMSLRLAGEEIRRGILADQLCQCLNVANTKTRIIF